MRTFYIRATRCSTIVQQPQYVIPQCMSARVRVCARIHRLPLFGLLQSFLASGSATRNSLDFFRGLLLLRRFFAHLIATMDSLDCGTCRTVAVS